MTTKQHGYLTRLYLNVGLILMAASALPAAPANAAFPFTASGITTSSGRLLDQLEVGDVVAVDITFRNEDPQPVSAIGAGAFGYGG